MRNFISTPSPVELLTNNSAGVWDMLMNKRLYEELVVRKRLRQHLDYIAGPKPLGVCSSDVSDELYQSLNSLLGTGLNDRFVLYCPFDIIPTADS